MILETIRGGLWLENPETTVVAFEQHPRVWPALQILWGLVEQIMDADRPPMAFKELASIHCSSCQSPRHKETPDPAKEVQPLEEDIQIVKEKQMTEYIQTVEKLEVDGVTTENIPQADHPAVSQGSGRMYRAWSRLAQIWCRGGHLEALGLDFWWTRTLDWVLEE